MSSYEGRKAELEAMTQTEKGQDKLHSIYMRHYHGLQENGLWDGRVVPPMSFDYMVTMILKVEFPDYEDAS
jgi:hypothetical protein